VRIFHIDLVTGAQFSTGSNNIVLLRGDGTFVPGAGRLVLDSSGNVIEHDGPDTATEREQLCEALA